MGGGGDRVSRVFTEHGGRVRRDRNPAWDMCVLLRATARGGGNERFTGPKQYRAAWRRRPS